MREEVFEGRTEEEALLKASDALGVNISDMDYEIVEQETGLFGLFRKSVKVRVRVPDAVPGIVYRENAHHGPSREGASVAVGSEDTRVQTVRQDGPSARKGLEAETTLRGILERMGVRADITATEDEDSIRLNITTDEREVVIGRDGEVLSALQFVLNKMVNRFPDGRKRIVLDAEGFRDRRTEELTRMAERLADKAIRTGRVIRLFAMNAQDRRVVHMALKDRPGLSTRSEGEGLFRCLMIVPTGGGRPHSGTGRRSRGKRGPRPHPDQGRLPSA